MPQRVEFRQTIYLKIERWLKVRNRVKPRNGAYDESSFDRIRRQCDVIL